MYNRVDLYVTIHKPILLGGLVMFSDKNKKNEKNEAISKIWNSFSFFFELDPPPPLGIV